MGADRLPMRQIREILRLKYESRLSCRAIARACGVGVGTVSEYLRRGQQAGVSWPLLPELDEVALEARLFPPAEPGRELVSPDLVRIHQELKRSGVTLHLLWEEYREVHADGYGLRRSPEVTHLCLAKVTQARISVTGWVVLFGPRFHPRRRRARLAGPELSPLSSSAP